MNEPNRLPRSLAGRPFSVSEALDLGVSSNRLRASALDRPFHGVREETPNDGSLSARVRAYQARMPQNEFFSHSTAALLLGVPLPGSLESRPELHVSVLAPAAPPETAGVVGHFLQVSRIVEAQGCAVAAPEAVWCQLAGQLRLEDLVAAGDYLVTGRDPYHGEPAFTTSFELAEAIKEHKRRRGIRTAKEALPLIRVGARSRPESHLRLAIVQAGLPEPRINMPVRLRDGREVVLDLAYPKLKLGLEYEGDWHRTDQQKWLSDLSRREDLADIDWEMMRVDRQQLYDQPGQLLTRIRRRMRARANR